MSMSSEVRGATLHVLMQAMDDLIRAVELQQAAIKGLHRIVEGQGRRIEVLEGADGEVTSRHTDPAYQREHGTCRTPCKECGT